MASKHKFKLLDFQLNEQAYSVAEGDGIEIVFHTQSRRLNLSFHYFTGKKKTVFLMPIREKAEINLTLEPDDYKIDVFTDGDEQIKKIKNMGGGALVGAVVAGPFGAAAGAYVGTKFKQVPCKILIPSESMLIKAMVNIGFVEDQKKAEYFE